MGVAVKRTACLVGGPRDGEELENLDPRLGVEGFPKKLGDYKLTMVSAEHDGEVVIHSAKYMHKSMTHEKTS